MTLPLIVGIPLLLAPCAPFAWRYLGQWWPRIACLVILTVVGLLLSLMPAAIRGEALIFRAEWLPQLGLDVALRADGFGLFMSLIITGIGAGILSYAGGYLGDDERTGSITGWLLLFMAAMLGVALADNIILLFVSWEMTSFSSFMLIGTNHRDPNSRAGAKTALLVTALGGLALLGGMVILGHAAGSWHLSDFPPLHNHPWATGAFICICLAAFTKSAQWPFSFWLPGAMAAPTPISAYLHSATMVKAGVFLLARMHPVLGEHVAWTPTLVVVSCATMLLVILAVPKATDLKALLAYSTIGALAVLVCLIGIGTDKAMTAMVIFLLAHACYKGPLFLVAGAIDHAVHSRDINRLGGLAKVMPWTMATGVIAGLSMVGILPMLGFVAKEYALEASLKHSVWVTSLITALAAAFVFVACCVVVIPAFGKKRELAAHAHEAPWSMLVPMLSVSSLGLVFGLGLGPLEAWVVEPALGALGVKAYPLALWHGVNTAFLLSGTAIAVGLVAFLTRGQLARWAPPLPSGHAIHEACWNGMVGLGKAVTRLLQNGSLTMYVGTTMVVMSALVLYAWLHSDAPMWPHRIEPKMTW